MPNGLLTSYEVRMLCATMGLFRINGNFELDLCISMTWPVLHSEGLMIAVMMIWSDPAASEPGQRQLLQIAAPAVPGVASAVSPRRETLRPALSNAAVAVA